MIKISTTGNWISRLNKPKSKNLSQVKITSIGATDKRYWISFSGYRINISQIREASSV